MRIKRGPPWFVAALLPSTRATHSLLGRCRHRLGGHPPSMGRVPASCKAVLPCQTRCLQSVLFRVAYRNCAALLLDRSLQGLNLMG